MKTFLTLALVSGLLSHVSSAADIEAWLAKPILDPNLPQKQVEDYCEARVLRMPEVTSAKEWETLAKKYREDTLREVVFRGAAKWREMETKVKFLDTIEGGPEYRIRKLIYEAVPGLWIPALLYEPKNLDGPAPVVLNVNGHDRKDGKAADYKQTRCINQAKRGMIALNVEWVGMGQLNTPGFTHYKMNQLDLCGTSGLAPFYLSMSRGLDILLEHKHADPDRVAVAGLSGGGWQTIIISSLDERVTLSDPVAGYSSFLTRIHNHSDLGDSEQTPVDLGAIADYAHLTAMRAPRPTLLTFNLNDNCCFASPHALQPLLDAAKPIYKLYDEEDSLRWHVNEDPGTHNFGKDNRQALYRMFGTFFYPDDETFNANEIACEDELKTNDELHVPLPEGNEDFHSLALKLSESLPKPPSGPIAGKPITHQEYRQKLADVLRLEKPLTVTAEKHGESTSADGITATQWKLQVGDEWTLPAIELAPASFDATSIVLGDAGRKLLGAEVESLLASKHRVIAVDPFYIGESRIRSRDFLFALLVSTVGRRPLGIQSSQINAVAEWAKSSDKNTPVHIHSFGPRTSLMALCAKAVRGESIDGLHLTDSMTSLKEVITQDIGVNQQPELFCFGLLENFDIPLLKVMAGLTAGSSSAQSPAASPEIRNAAATVSQIIAHRGASTERPECTVSAIRRAIEVGATAVEVDVRTSRDGELFILHDSTLDRTTNGKGPASALTLAELQQLDAGSWFDAKFKNERIPSLIESARECNGRIDLLLDLKEQGDDYDRKVVGVIRQHGDPAGTIVGVRSVPQAERFRKLLPKARQLALIPSVDSIEDFAKAGVDVIRLWPKWLEDGDAPVRRVQATGKGLHLNGTKGEREETLKLLLHQPDSLSSDDPRRLLATLKQIAEAKQQ